MRILIREKKVGRNKNEWVTFPETNTGAHWTQREWQWTRKMKRKAIRQLENTPGNRRLYVRHSLTLTSYFTTYSLRYPTIAVGHPQYRYIYRYVLGIIFFRFLFLFVKKLHLHVHKTVQRTSCHSQSFLFKYSINITHRHLGYKR